MALSSQRTADRLNDDIALERLVVGRGVELTKRGAVLVGKCPLCSGGDIEVAPKTNTFACSGCKASGGVVDWVMAVEGVSLKHAVELLRENVLGEPAGRIVRKATIPKLGGVVDADADPHAIVRAVIDYYHECLKQSPEALAYLDRRGLRDSSMIEHFRLGFCNRTLAYRIPAKNRKAGAAIRGVLAEAGLLKASGHEYFRGSVVFPVLDGERVAQCYGRKITGNLRKGTPDHLWLSGQRHGVWNRAALAGEEVILCESIIDALTFWCAGYRHVTAIGGPDAMTDELIEAIGASPVQRVLIAFDRDDAGDAGADAASERLMVVGAECFRVVLPKGADANSYYLVSDCSAEALGAVLRAARWLCKGGGRPLARATPQTSTAAFSTVSEGRVHDATASKSTLIEQASNDGAVAPEVEPKHESVIQSEAEAAVDPGHQDLVQTAAAASGAIDRLSNQEVQQPVEQQTVTPHESPLPASPVSALPPCQPEAEVKGHEVVMLLGDRRWRIRGLDRCMAYDQLRVNVLCGIGEQFHVDTFDLYSAKHRTAFIASASTELGIKDATIKRDLGRVLLKLEDLQDQQIQAAFEDREATYEMTEDEKAAAMDLLRSPDLLDTIVADITACGVVGEDTNKLVVYLAAISRKLQDPLAILIQSSSAAGKSSLLGGVLVLVPGEDRIMYSAMTGQSLFYMGESDLKHRVLAIAEEDGVAQAAYALKLLQSEGELTIASTGKEASTGRLVSHAYRVEGPVALMLTTTAIDVDEELLNRCLVVAVDENRSQTRAIHEKQRQAQMPISLAERSRRDVIISRHQNAQRLLRPVLVANPYAQHLGFPDVTPRTRRDHPKYLALIRSITLLHQYQRQAKSMMVDGHLVEYIETELSDIAIANRIAHEVLGRSIDELPPQTRRLLDLLREMVVQMANSRGIELDDVRFTRRDVRAYTGTGDTQAKTHLRRLRDLEFVVVERGRSGLHEYQLLRTDGVDDERLLPGLRDVDEVKQRYDAARAGSDGQKAAVSRPVVGARSVPGRAGSAVEMPSQTSGFPPVDKTTPETARLGSENHEAGHTDAETR